MIAFRYVNGGSLRILIIIFYFKHKIFIQWDNFMIKNSTFHYCGLNPIQDILKISLIRAVL